MPSHAQARTAQQSRSALTRAKILDATLQCLVERGYAATSTPEVCRRAGVSRGALLHHFPTKEELVISAVAHLADRRTAEIRAQPPQDGAHSDRLGLVFEHIWAGYFKGPLFQAALELWIAARCDPKLHEALYPVELALGRSIRSLYREIGAPEIAGDPQREARFEDVVALTVHLLRGMALQKILKDDDEERRRLFDRWKEFARRHVGARADTASD